jgi:hypothetical protein
MEKTKYIHNYYLLRKGPYFNTSSSMSKNILVENKTFMLIYEKEKIQASDSYIKNEQNDAAWLADISFEINENKFVFTKYSSPNSAVDLANLILMNGTVNDKKLINTLFFSLQNVFNDKSVHQKFTMEQKPSEHISKLLNNLEYDKSLIAGLDEETKYKIIKKYKSELKLHHFFNDSRDHDLFKSFSKYLVTNFLNQKIKDKDNGVDYVPSN